MEASTSGKERRAPSSRSSGRALGRGGYRAGGGVAPCLVGERFVHRLFGCWGLVCQDAVQVRFVERPMEDPPVPAVQQRYGLPEALEQAGVVERVEHLPVIRMDRVVDDHAPETEVTHDRARLRERLRLGAAEAFLNGERQLLDRNH